MSVVQFIKILFMLFVIQIITACGGDFEWFPEDKQTSSTNANQTTQSTQSDTFVSYNFTATVDQITGTPAYPVTIGDNITGKFVYQLNAADWNVSSQDQGYFHDMNDPSGVEIQIDTYKVKLNESYSISINNDDSSAPPTRDTFEVFSKNTSSNVQIILSFNDLTAAVFSRSTCNSLPQSLSLGSFDNNYIFINSNDSSSWSIRLQPNSLTKI